MANDVILVSVYIKWIISFSIMSLHYNGMSAYKFDNIQYYKTYVYWFIKFNNLITSRDHQQIFTIIDAVLECWAIYKFSHFLQI